MSDIWDYIGDLVTKGDRQRDVSPKFKFIQQDELKTIHYIFTHRNFVNPKYSIPSDEFQLFENFLIGGSRSYPSDGSTPVDIAASEAFIILDRIEEIAKDPKHTYHESAAMNIKENGKLSLVRGAIKLYLGGYTSNDWKRKRFTDDIDFWIYNKILFESVLVENGWVKNRKTKEFEKSIKWYNFATNEEENGILIASDDVEQRMDFGAGSFLEGSTLKDIFKKKLKRGHEVDLSDMINVIMMNRSDPDYEKENEEWASVWIAFEEATNTRDNRITSNIITLCRYAYGVASHLKRVSDAIQKYRGFILDSSKYPTYQVIKIYKNSNQWLSSSKILEMYRIRSKIYEELLEQEKLKLSYSKNLKDFAKRILHLLNLKYSFCNTKFIVTTDKTMNKFIEQKK